MTYCNEKPLPSIDVEKRKMHWKKWEDIAVPKSDGGKGFRDFGKFNQALLGKHGWRLITKPNSLCAKVLKGKYFHNREFMEATRRRGSSHIWQAILHGRNALHCGLIKRVGNASTIDTWKDPWITDNHNSRP